MKCQACGRLVDPANCDWQQGRCIHRVKPPAPRWVYAVLIGMAVVFYSVLWFIH